MSKTADKSLEQWLWDAACVIRGEKDAPKYKDYILPLVFVKRLCDVFDDEVNRIAEKVKSREKALKLIEKDPKLVRFYLPLRAKDIEKDDTWSVIRSLTTKVGEKITSRMRDIAKFNPRIKGIIDRIDFNATTHGQRDINDDSLIKLIEKISQKRLGLKNVEPDIIGRSYEYLIRKFAEGSGQSAGEFYTPKEVGMIMSRILNPKSGMEIYDPCCGSGGLLIKCGLVNDEKTRKDVKRGSLPLKLYGQEYYPSTWAMANMNMVIHDMEGQFEIGDSMKNPKFKEKGKLKRFDLVVANPMWNQDMFTQKDYENDEYDRFTIGYPPNGTADWGWIQHIFHSLKDSGKAAVILGSGSASRGSGSSPNNVEKKIRKYFVDNDFIECIILLPFNLFYNTDAPGVIYILNKNKNSKRTKKIMFINVSEGFVKGKPKNILSEESCEQIISSYNNWEEIDGISKIVDLSKVLENDYLLTPSKYVYKLKDLHQFNIDQLIATYSEMKNEESVLSEDVESLLYDAVKSQKVKLKPTIFGEINSLWETEPLSKFISEFNVRGKEHDYPVLTCSKIYGIILQRSRFNCDIASTNKSNYKVVKPNMFVYDPMLLWDGSIGRNNYNFSGIVSPAYTVFEVNDSLINIDYLEYILRCIIMLPFYISISDGTNKRRRKAKFNDFKKLEIPVPKNNVQKLFPLLNREYRLLENKLHLLKDLKDSYFKFTLEGCIKKSSNELVTMEK